MNTRQDTIKDRYPIATLTGILRPKKKKVFYDTISIFAEGLCYLRSKELIQRVLAYKYSKQQQQTTFMLCVHVALPPPHTHTYVRTQTNKQTQVEFSDHTSCLIWLTQYMKPDQCIPSNQITYKNIPAAHCIRKTRKDRVHK